VKINFQATVSFPTISLVLLLACSAGLSAQGPGGRGAVLPNNPPPTSPVTGDPANGKKLFFAYSCYACHGYNGETGARRFVGTWGHLATEQEFILFLRARANVASFAFERRMIASNLPSLCDSRSFFRGLES